MSENLIYGADITAYGAVADGKTDCSDAFTKAIENGESLISVPYGKYIIRKTLKLVSNVKIHLHANAEIIFDVEEDVCLSADDCGLIILDGGRWTCLGEGKTFMSAKDSSGIKVLESCICSHFGFCFEECRGINIKNVSFDTEDDCIIFKGENEDISLRNIIACSGKSFISTGENAEVEKLYINDVTLSCVGRFMNIESGKLEEARIYGIYGDFTESLIRVSESAEIEDADLEEIEVFCSDAEKACAYFDFKGIIEGVEINSFKRDSDAEATPLISTMIFTPCRKSTAIIDGVTLDNIICARGKSKTVGVVPARLTNPTNKFIYTLECNVEENDTLTLPLGDFCGMTVYTKQED